MVKEKSPFRGYSIKEVYTMENNYFNLQFGGDFILENDFYLFTANEVTKLYKKTILDLVDIVRNGNDKDRKYAMELIAGVVIRPMRLH